MKLLIFSDLHGNQLELPSIKPDIVLLLGDIYWKDVEKIEKMYDCPKLGVLGNHDREDTFNRTSVVNLHKELFVYKGISFAGFEGSPRYSERGTLQYTEKEVSDYMKELKSVDIFLAHANPMWEINMDSLDSHRGFDAFREYIEQKQPSVFLHGHLHESYNMDVGDTTIYSVYPYLVLNIR